jgi:hypothetical protein
MPREGAGPADVGQSRNQKTINAIESLVVFATAKRRLVVFIQVVTNFI